MGHGRRHAGELLADALNSRVPQIFDTIRGGDERTPRPQRRSTPRRRRRSCTKIKTAFQTWIWSDPDRTDRLARVYNDRFNNIARATSTAPTCSCPAPQAPFQLYAHQKRGIWRIISAGSTYLAHAVGAGKTLTPWPRPSWSRSGSA